MMRDRPHREFARVDWSDADAALHAGTARRRAAQRAWARSMRRTVLVFALVAIPFCLFLCTASTVAQRLDLAGRPVGVVLGLGAGALVTAVIGPLIARRLVGRSPNAWALHHRRVQLLVAQLDRGEPGGAVPGTAPTAQDRAGRRPKEHRR